MMIKLSFNSLVMFFFVSSLLFFIFGFVFYLFDFKSLYVFLGWRVGCVSDAGPIFYWQVISSHFLLCEAFFLNLIFFSQKSVRTNSFVVKMSNARLIFVILFCSLLAFVSIDAVIGYEIQCIHPRAHWLLRYGAFTLGMNVVHVIFFILFFLISAIVRRILRGF